MDCKGLTAGLVQVVSGHIFLYRALHSTERDHVEMRFIKMLIDTD